MKIAVIGAGGVGGYFGGKLANAGYQVSFLARGKHLEALKSNGLTVKSILGDFKVAKPIATDRMNELGQSDLIILGIKAWQIKEIRQQLASVIHENTTVLPLQNGVVTVNELAEVIDKNKLIGGLCKIISKIDAPGVINHFAVTPQIVFGEINHKLSSRVKKIKTVFDMAGINSRISADIDSDIWKKFIPICIGGLLALTRTTYGELREMNETRQMMIDLLQENFKLSQLAGITIAPDFVDKTISLIDTFPRNTTTSLSRDIWEGRPSEIDYQNGTVVKLAAKFGMSVPINKFIYNCILPMEQKAREKFRQF